MKHHVKITSKICLLLISGAVLPAGAMAQSIVAPNAFATTPGDVGSVNFLGIPSRTYQFQISAAELSGFSVGTRLNSITMRVTSGQNGNFPISIANWNLQLGQATNSIANMSSTFANNIQNAVTVKSGPISFAGGAFPSGAATGSANAWGPEIMFSTPYVYQGGDLVLLLSHGASTIQNASSVTGDALSPNAAGYGIRYRALTNTTENATTATNMNASATIIRLSAEPVPEPGTLLLLSSGLALLKLRRKAKA